MKQERWLVEKDGKVNVQYVEQLAGVGPACPATVTAMVGLRGRIDFRFVEVYEDVQMYEEVDDKGAKE